MRIAAPAITRKTRLRDLFTPLTAAGVWLLTGGLGGQDLDPVGVLFAFAAGFFWGTYIVLGRRLGQLDGGGAGLALAMVVATVVVAIPGVASGGSSLLVPSVLLFGALVALLSAAIPFSLEIEAMRRIPSTTFGVMMSLEPAVAAIVGLIVLGQSIELGEALAILLVVAASAGVLGHSPAGRTMRD
ncbi:MAG: EamA family transporter [Solirubrobacterales bacterium]